MANNIIQGFPTPQKNYYKVYVQSTTYNQASYIEDCLNGVAMQQTDFPFVHHVIDDCSTDGEQKVIKTYLNNNCDMENAEYYDNDICSITIAKNKSNPSCTLAVYFLKKNMYRNPEKRNLYKLWEYVCPYEALCEGDDYWITTDKLQKQYDYMEAHPECSMCFHSALVEDPDGHQEKHEPKIKKTFYKTDDIIMDKGGTCNLSYMHVLNSIFHRTEYMQKEDIPDFWKLCPIGDLPLSLYLIDKGYFGYIDEVMSVYRRFAAGAWTSKHIKTSLKSLLAHKRKILMMWRQFDEYTNYKYHRIIKKKKNIYKINILMCIIKHPLKKILSLHNS